MKDNLKERFKQERYKKVLMQKLLSKKISINDLDRTQANETIDYFIKDIENMDNELYRIKQHIIYMQKKLKSNA